MSGGLDKRVGSKETDQTEAKSKRENHEDVKQSLAVETTGFIQEFLKRWKDRPHGGLRGSYLATSWASSS